MVVKKKIMKINLKRKITLILFVILVGSVLFFNHSIYFATIFVSFVVINEYLYEKFKSDNDKTNKTTKKLIEELECMISGEYREDTVEDKATKDMLNKMKDNSESRSEKNC